MTPSASPKATIHLVRKICVQTPFGRYEFGFAAFVLHRTHKGELRMSIIGWIILGLIAGYIGSRIVDKEGKGLWLNLALGIVGAIVGGLIFSALGFSGVTGVDLYSMIVAIIGSVVVLWVYHATAGRRPV
jgi:uncharacterized membrane protein YeaQ/YmgE (transglycosylase-associated protein family)